MTTITYTTSIGKMQHAFESFLREKSSLIVSYNYWSRYLFIPLSEAVKKLPESKRSYRDSGIVYQVSPGFRKRLAEISSAMKRIDKRKIISQI
jgi:hypothetical protein